MPLVYNAKVVPPSIGRLFGSFLSFGAHWLFAREYDRMSTPNNGGAMGAGYWLNPDTGQCVRVATTHDEWVRDRGNAESIGLSKHAYANIMKHPATAVDEIRLLALHDGLVRIREHPRYTSIQVAAHAHRVTPILRAVLVTLKAAQVHTDTTLKIDNLLSNGSVTIGLGELGEKVARDQSIFHEQDD